MRKLLLAGAVMLSAIGAFAMPANAYSGSSNFRDGNGTVCSYGWANSWVNGSYSLTSTQWYDPNCGSGNAGFSTSGSPFGTIYDIATASGGYVSTTDYTHFAYSMNRACTYAQCGYFLGHTMP